MFLGGGNVFGQVLICLGVEEDIGFFVFRLFEQGWDVVSFIILLDEMCFDVVINFVFYYDWFQVEQVEVECLGVQECVVECFVEFCQYYEILLVQLFSYWVFDGVCVIVYSEKDEIFLLGLCGQVFWCMEQSVCVVCL